MAEPENLTPPYRPDPNTAPPNFLFAVQIVPRGGTFWKLAVQNAVCALQDTVLQVCVVLLKQHSSIALCEVRFPERTRKHKCEPFLR